MELNILLIYILNILGKGNSLKYDIEYILKEILSNRMNKINTILSKQSNLDKKGCKFEDENIVQKQKLIKMLDSVNKIHLKTIKSIEKYKRIDSFAPYLYSILLNNIDININEYKSEIEMIKIKFKEENNLSFYLDIQNQIKNQS